MKTKILGILRHVLTFGGGYIAAKGWLPEEAMPEVIGAVMTVIGTVWSVKDKN
tara:strand:+ start:219 stop:377 length:159 start_codon:yes stop_codon:yes gene_type:complete